MERPVVPKRGRDESQPQHQEVEEQEQEEEEEEQVQSEEASKRHKPYTHILSLLESEEDDPSQDLSPIITTLQQEISFSSFSDAPPNPPQQPTHHHNQKQEEHHNDTVMRRLLEASDDELGIPNTAPPDSGFFDFGEAAFDPSLCNPFWELEDHTANYYTFLQSQLFL